MCTRVMAPWNNFPLKKNVVCFNAIIYSCTLFYTSKLAITACPHSLLLRILLTGLFNFNGGKCWMLLRSHAFSVCGVVNLCLNRNISYKCNFVKICSQWKRVTESLKAQLMERLDRHHSRSLLICLCVVQTSVCFQLYENIPGISRLGMWYFCVWYKFQKIIPEYYWFQGILFAHKFFIFYSHVKGWESHILMRIKIKPPITFYFHLISILFFIFYF